MTRRVGAGARPEEAWKPYLQSGERILWTGAPATGLRFRPRNLALSLFGLFFFAFSAFWIRMASSMMSDIEGIFAVFPWFGLPFALVGLHMLLGQYFWDAYRRSKTTYAISNKHAFIASRHLGQSVKTYPIGRDASLDYEPGDEANLFFTSRMVRTKNGSYEQRIGFEYISDGDAVYRIIRDVRKDSG